MFQIYYGMGKGKTSALNGAALRAFGAELKVKVYRFLKGRHSHENQVLEKVGIEVEMFHYGQKFVIQMNDEERKKAKLIAFEGMQKIIQDQHKYDVIIIDEFLDLMDETVNFCKQNDILSFIEKINKDKEIIVSGHSKYDKVFDKADLISYINPERHYFNKGVSARKGFEY